MLGRLREAGCSASRIQYGGVFLYNKFCTI